MSSSMPSWTPLQREVIDALGMPVWLRTSLAAAPRPEPTPPPTSDRAVLAPELGRGSAQTRSARPGRPAAGNVGQEPGSAPSFDLSFTHLGAAIVVCDRIGDGVAHLARDIALVVGSRAHAPQPVTLQWPGKLGAAIATDAAAAQSAAQGLLDKLLTQAKPRVIVVCGTQATRFFLPAQDWNQDWNQDQGTSQQGELTYVWTSAARTSVSAKRALWGRLQPLLANWRDA